MADDDESFINIEFLLRAGWHFAHRQMQAALDARGGKFPWLAHVDEPGAIFAQDLGSFSGGDFVGQHEFQFRWCRARDRPGCPLLAKGRFSPMARQKGKLKGERYAPMQNA